MVGYIDKQTLQDIADAIRTKNGSEETYKPSEMADAIRGIEGGGDGFDFTTFGYSKEYSNKTNALLLEGITEAFDKFEANASEKTWINLYAYSSDLLFSIPYTPPNVYDIGSAFRNSFVIDISNFDFSNITACTYAFASCKIRKIPSVFNFSNVKNSIAALFTQCTFEKPLDFVFNIGEEGLTLDVQQLFRSANWKSPCSVRIIGSREIKNMGTIFQQPTFTEPLTFFEYLNSIKLTSIALSNGISAKKIKFGSLENCTNFVISPTNVCEVFEFDNWKQGDLNLSALNLLTPQSIHYIIQHAMSIADGATARTLTLHATAKTNWEASEYYQEDLAVLEEKGITIA